MDTDLVILGGGPAGLTAGMYAARARIPLIILERGQTGGQMAATATVDNYPGFTDPIFGAELAERMETQARKFGVTIQYGDVQSIERKTQGFTVSLESADPLQCQAIIIATGASPVKLGIPGELDLAGKGVSYCAVCDGPFFQGFDVAVVGGGDSAVEEAVYLTRFAGTVHIIHRRDDLRACKEIQEKALAEPRIVVHWSTIPVEIIGDGEVKGIRIRSVKTGQEETLSVGGVFFYVGLRPNSEPFRHLVETDSAGFVLTDQDMNCSNPGLFAAGDIRVKTLRQISTAIGDGAIAAYSAQHYLEKLPR
ncbi:MAG: thioredoxin reductase [Thermodesulfobacteriota bacterium]|nr:thioredoxin reductase [Thermodesulfobacteriota bacterium]